MLNKKSRIQNYDDEVNNKQGFKKLEGTIPKH